MISKETINKSKDGFWVLVNFALVVFVLFGLVGLFGVSKWMNSIPPAQTITVSAEGKATLTPDIVRFNFSVVSQGDDPEALQEENAGKMTSAIDFVKEQGVEDKDIQTSSYNLYPRYRYDRVLEESLIDGYEIRQTATVKVRDLEKAPEILSGLTKAGVNQISQMTFDIDDRDQYLEKAREEAFKKAFEKAEAMTKYSGLSLGRVITFSENQYGGGPMPYYAYSEDSRGFGGGEVAPPIEPGSEEVTVNVSVVYEIK